MPGLKIGLEAIFPQIIPKTQRKNYEEKEKEVEILSFCIAFLSW